jgi:hypothetical protein
LDLCNVLPPDQQNVEVLSQDFFDTFAMSSQLFSNMWTFCRMISVDFCYVQVAVKGNVDVLSQDLCKNTDAAVRRKNRKKYHETVPLNDMRTTLCLGSAVVYY